MHYKKLNEYMLEEIFEGENLDFDGVIGGSSITRTFNFLSGQVRTVAKDYMYEPQGANAGAAAAVSTQMKIENFTELASLAEVRLMREKLVEMGGAPPDLEEILPGFIHKPRSLGAKP